MSNLRRLSKKTFGKYQLAQSVETAILGDNSGTVAVPGRANFSYCRLGGQVIQVYNTRVPAAYGVKVLIGYDPAMPRLQQVLSLAPVQVATGSGSGGAGLVNPHEETHRWLGQGPGGGMDWLPVELRQFMPLRIEPAGGLTIRVYRGVLWIDGAPAFHDYEIVDLTSDLPVTSGNALYALITINDSNAVTVTLGSEAAIADLALSDVPAVPTGTQFVLGAVRLYEGQTDIIEGRTFTDILDLRFPPYGSGAGGGTVNAGSGVHVYRSTNFDHNSSGTYLAIDFDSERLDTDGYHDPATNPSRLTCVKAGNYAISGNVYFAANGTGVRGLGIRLNGGDYIALDLRNNNGGTSGVIMDISTEYHLGLGDYVELYAVQTSGGSLAINASINYSPEFRMDLIGEQLISTGNEEAQKLIWLGW